MVINEIYKINDLIEANEIKHSIKHKTREIGGVGELLDKLVNIVAKLI